MASDNYQAGHSLRRLQLRVGYPHDRDRADFVTVKILVDGQDLLANAGPHAPYCGPWPPALLGDDSPLIPADPPVRVLLYFEGEPDPDASNITAIIGMTHDQVTWADFRECRSDTAVDPDGMFFELHPARSTPLNVPDLVFDRGQYLAEVWRAITDREWESDRWRTAQLLEEYLSHAWTARPGRTDADFGRYYAEPADGDDPRFLVTMWNNEDPEQGIVVALTAAPGTPEQQCPRSPEVPHPRSLNLPSCEGLGVSSVTSAG